MNRIATGQVYAASLLGILNAQSRQAVAGRQLSSGLVATDLKGFADKGATLAAAQTVKSRTDQLVANNISLADRLAAQDQALGGVEQAVTGARAAVASAVANGGGAVLMQQLNGWLGQAAQAMNAQYAGQPLFAGGTVDGDPVTARTTADLLAPATPSDSFRDGDLKRVDRIDEGVTVDTSFRARDIGGPFLQVLADIAAYDQPPTGPFGAKLTDAQAAFLQTKLAPLDAVAAGVRSLAAANGVNQARVDATQAQLAGRADAAGALISHDVDADPAEATTRLQLAGVALQASAQVFTTLSGSSLLNVLQR